MMGQELLTQLPCLKGVVLPLWLPRPCASQAQLSKSLGLHRWFHNPSLHSFDPQAFFLKRWWRSCQKALTTCLYSPAIFAKDMENLPREEFRLAFFASSWFKSGTQILLHVVNLQKWKVSWGISISLALESMHMTVYWFLLWWVPSFMSIKGQTKALLEHNSSSSCLLAHSLQASSDGVNSVFLLPWLLKHIVLPFGLILTPTLSLG